MNLSVGQLLGGAGIVANRMRATERDIVQQQNELLQQRENLIRMRELENSLAIRARMGEGAEAAANVPIPRFETIPGVAVGDPNAQPPAVAPAPAPAPAPAANAPAAAPAANRPAPATVAPQPLPAAAFRPGVRPPAQLTNVPTSELSAEEFQMLPPTERLRRLNDLNRERQAAVDRAQLMKAPAAAGDVLAGGLYNAIAGGLTAAGNALGIPRIGRALGIYDSDVTRVEVPKVGTGSATPYFDMIRQVEQANQPLTEAQLLAGMKKSDVERIQKLQEKNRADVANAPKMFAELEAKYNLPPNLLNAVMMAESRGIPGQTSRAGAQGYFQFMPETAKQYKVKVNDLGSEADGAARLLSDLLKASDNNVEVALAKYNWGSGNFQRGGGMNKLPAETRAYIPKVLGFMSSPVTVSAAPAASAPPAVAVNNAVQTGTVKEVADAASTAVAPPAPSKDGTLYGPTQVDTSIANPQIQQILTTRSALQRQVALFNQYGMGDKAWEAVSKIQAIDLGLYKNQAELGVYEGAATGNFSRAMSVLSTFTGSPHQVLRRPDGKFDLYVNGKVTKAALDGTQVELLVRTQVDSEYRQRLAALQTERAQEQFKSDLRIREESNKTITAQVLQTAREVQLEVIKGNVKLAEKKLEMAGYKAVASGAGDGKVTYSNGLGDFFVIDTLNNQVEVNGTKLDVGPRAQRVAGIPIWSTVNSPSVGQ